MIRITIPEELRERFDLIVEELYGGDEVRACQDAVEVFIKQRSKNLSSGTKFEEALSQRMRIEEDKDGHTDKGFGDALERLKERKERLKHLF